MDRHAVTSKGSLNELTLPGIESLKPKKKPQAVQAYSTKYYQSHIQPVFEQKLTKLKQAGKTFVKITERNKLIQAMWEDEKAEIRDKIENELAQWVGKENTWLEREKARMVEGIKSRPPDEYQQCTQSQTWLGFGLIHK